MIHDLIRMVNTDMVQGLSLKEEGANEAVQPQGLLLRDLEALTCLGTGFLILFLCSRCGIESFLQGAVILCFATVADIRWFGKLLADLQLIVRTGFGTGIGQTELAESIATHVATKLFDRTCFTDQTVVEGHAVTAGLLELEMASDFLGNCRGIFPQFSRHLLE